MPDLN
jgi:hypothetical protein